MPDFVIRVKVDPQEAVSGKSAAVGALGEIGAAAKQTESATASLVKQYQALRASIDPVIAAQTQLASGTSILTAAMNAGLATSAETARLMGLQRTQLEAALSPYEARIAALQEETQLMRLSSGEREVQTRLLAMENDLRLQGVAVTDEQTAAMLEQLRAQQAITAETAAAHASNTGGGGTSFGGSIGSLAIGGLAVGEIAHLSDEFGNMQNKLRALYPSEQDATRGLSALYDVAQQTRSSWENTVGVFARVKQATDELHLSQTQQIALTKELNQAAVISGVSNAEAARGIMDLVHGLAQGSVNMRELRQVMAQMPAVAQVLEEHFHVTAGGLMELAHTGKLAAAGVVDALSEAGPELEERFGRTTSTIGQSFTELKNALVRLVGELQPVFSALATGIGYVADGVGLVTGHLGEAAAIAGSLALGVGGLGIAAVGAYEGLSKLNDALGSPDPVGAFLNMQELKMKLLDLNDAIDASARSFSNWRTMMNIARENTGEFATEAVLKLADQLHAFTTRLVTDSSLLDAYVHGVTEFTHDAIENVRHLQEEQHKGATAAAEHARQIEALSKQLQGISDDADPASAALKRFDDAVTLVNRSQQAGIPIANQVLDGLDALREKYIAVRNAKIDAGLAKADIGTFAGSADGGIGATADAYSKQLDAARAEQEIVERTKGAFAKYLSQQDGPAKGLEEFRKKFLDTSHDIRDALTSAFQDGNKELIALVTGGSASFSDFAKSIEKDLAEMALKALEANLFGALFSAASGGSSNLFAGTLLDPSAWGHHAHGTDYMVRGNGGTDSVPQFFMTSPGERVIVQTQAQQAAASTTSAAPVVHVHNVNAFDPGTIHAAMAGNGGQRTIVNVMKARPDVMAALTRRQR